jgi:hypothetical protein
MGYDWDQIEDPSVRGRDDAQASDGSGVRKYALGDDAPKGKDLPRGEDRLMGLPDWGEPPRVEEEKGEVLSWVVACALVGAAIAMLYAVTLYDPAAEANKPPGPLQQVLDSY